jgi:hypothetical protein
MLADTIFRRSSRLQGRDRSGPSPPAGRSGRRSVGAVSSASTASIRQGPGPVSPHPDRTHPCPDVSSMPSSRRRRWADDRISCRRYHRDLLPAGMGGTRVSPERPALLLPAAAEAEYRACPPCHPYRVEPSITWTGPEHVCRAVQLILDGALHGKTEHDLMLRCSSRASIPNRASGSSDAGSVGVVIGCVPVPLALVGLVLERRRQKAGAC